MLIWILVIILILAAAIGTICLRETCLRRPVADMSDPAVIRAGSFAHLEGVLTEGNRWIREQGWEEVYTVSHDGKRLFARLMTQPGAKGTILFFHGYRSGYSLDFAPCARFYFALGYNLLLVDQRAHGKSQGTYLTFGVLERLDVRTWCRFLSERYGADHPLFSVGLSMGASTVLMASSEDLSGNVRGIIADCGFTSPGAIIRKVAAEDRHLPAVGLMLGILGLFTRIFAGFPLWKYSTVKAVRRTHYPILFIHGTADRFVPCSMTEEAYAACTGEKELLLVEGAGHGGSYLLDTEAYQRTARKFMEKHNGH